MKYFRFMYIYVVPGENEYEARSNFRDALDDIGQDIFDVNYWGSERISDEYAKELGFPIEEEQDA